MAGSMSDLRGRSDSGPHGGPGRTAVRAGSAAPGWVGPIVQHTRGPAAGAGGPAASDVGLTSVLPAAMASAFTAAPTSGAAGIPCAATALARDANVTVPR